MWREEGLNGAYAVLRAGPTIKGFVGSVALLSPPPLPWGGFICPFPSLVSGPQDALMAPCSLSVRYLNGNRP